MTTTSAVSTTFGKQVPARAGANLPQPGEISRSIANTIKEMYRELATRTLGDWLNISNKQSDRKLGCERSFSDDEIGALIRSEQGLQIVTAIMGDANPKWWRICAALMDAADVRQMQIVAQRRIAKTLREAIDADADITAAIQRSEALAFHDEEHMRPHLDALRAMARLSDRAVAPTDKGRK